MQQLEQEVYRRFAQAQDRMNLPRFVHVFMSLRKDYDMNLKGRHFLTLKDYTAEEILYLIELAADLKAKKK